MFIFQNAQVGIYTIPWFDCSSMGALIKEDIFRKTGTLPASILLKVKPPNHVQIQIQIQVAKKAACSKTTTETTAITAPQAILLHSPPVQRWYFRRLYLRLPPSPDRDGEVKCVGSISIATSN